MELGFGRAARTTHSSITRRHVNFLSQQDQKELKAQNCGAMHKPIQTCSLQERTGNTSKGHVSESYAREEKLKQQQNIQRHAQGCGLG